MMALDAPLPPLRLPEGEGLLGIFDQLLAPWVKRNDFFQEWDLSEANIAIARKVFELVTIPKGVTVFVTHYPIDLYRSPSGDAHPVIMKTMTVALVSPPVPPWPDFEHRAANIIEREMSGCAAFFFYTPILCRNSPLARWQMRCARVPQGVVDGRA